MVSKILGQLEALARWLQLKYMQSRWTNEVVEPGRLRFHPHDCKDSVLEEYQQRISGLDKNKAGR